MDDACRGLSLTPHFVSDPKKFRLLDLAAALGLPPDQQQTATPEQLRDVFSQHFDATVVASFKYFIPDTLLKVLTPVVNLHPSLLPKYRGASPLFVPLLRGDSLHGASIIRLWPGEGMDCGDVLKQASLPLRFSDDGRTVFPAVLDLGCDLLLDVLRDFRQHWDAAAVQDRKFVKSTDDEWHAPKMGKDFSRIDFGRMKGDDVCNMWRAFIGSRYALPHCDFHRMATPVASQLRSEDKIKPTRVSFNDMVHSSLIPAEVRLEADSVADSCKPGALYVPKSFGDKEKTRLKNQFAAKVSEKKQHQQNQGQQQQQPLPSQPVVAGDPAAIRCADKTWCWVRRVTLFQHKAQDMPTLATAMNMHAGQVFDGVFS